MKWYMRKPPFRKKRSRSPGSQHRKSQAKENNDKNVAKKL